MSSVRSWSLDPAKTRIYSTHVLAEAPRLLGLLDREPSSVTFGSFDREHWAWKFRDFPITMLQAGVYTLALLWRLPLPGSPFFASPRLITWLEGAIEATCRRQRRNGSFDSVAPYTQDHGVSLAMAYLLLETRAAAAEGLSAAVREMMLQTAHDAARFGLRSAEDHAFISNHQALFALAFQRVHQETGDSVFGERAEELIRSILAHQSNDGWYLEYGGCDPGYESLGLSYLARYWQLARSADLLESLMRSVEFFAHAVHPDGSAGGEYGSRCTALYVPDGFEILATESPVARAVCEHMRSRLDRGNVVTPSTADGHNLVILAQAYLMACLESRTDRAVLHVDYRLPCDVQRGGERFDWLTTWGTDRYYAVIGTGAGGATRVFDRVTETLAYEDAGYLVQEGGRSWISRSVDHGGDVARTEDGDGLSFSACFAELKQTTVTPWKLIVLRVLNYSLFRSLKLGGLVRRFIVGKLITGERSGPFRLERRMRFHADAVEISDTLSASPGRAVQKIMHLRSITPRHMGSARYFRASDLVPVPSIDATGAAESLRREGVAKAGILIQPGRAGAELAEPTQDGETTEAPSADN
jgi:hypothetical protein